MKWSKNKCNLRVMAPELYAESRITTGYALFFAGLVTFYVFAQSSWNLYDKLNAHEPAVRSPQAYIQFVKILLSKS